MFASIYRYRFFIINSVKTEFQTKFTRSKLGILWAIINPLIQVLIYTIVLSAVLSAKIPNIDSKFAYPIYLMSGMLCWVLFAEILFRCVNIFTDNANMIKKMAFPKVLLPFIVTVSSILNNFLLFLSMIIVFICFGHNLSFYIILLVIPVILTAILAFSAGLLFGVINVFIRDTAQIVNIFLQFAFWLTPIVYMREIVPLKFQYLFDINPLVWIMKFYREIILYNQIPSYELLIYPSIFSFFLLSVSFFVYNRAKDDMADAL